jgi:hypothetical protein
MPNIGEWFRRVWYLLNRSRVDAALRREMEDHRALMGDPARFGNALRLREESHDVWGWAWLDHLLRDLRYAWRMLRRTPGFTSVSVISLAAGFALAASTVAVLNAYVLRSLPYAHADRLYHVMYAPPGPWERRHSTGAPSATSSSSQSPRPVRRSISATVVRRRRSGACVRVPD